jgi:hypothetical protein
MKSCRAWFARALHPLVLLGLTAGVARAAPDPVQVTALLNQAKLISDRDAGRFWGKRLYGPMVIVDPMDRGVLANQADGAGALHPAGALYAGVLPTSVMVSDTPVEWSGKRWTELMWPLGPPDDTINVMGSERMRVTLAHEMFHRIQPSVGFIRPEVANDHLDTVQGRYLLQLEWRALAAALTAQKPAGRRTAVADALLFCAERYRVFPGAASNEAALEIDEGVAEYTGVRLGLESREARVRYTLTDLTWYLKAPSFVRTFAYASGPAYGLLLDQADPKWRGKVKATDDRLDRLLATAMALPAPDLAVLKQREAVYDADGSLYAAEVKRDQDRQARLAAFQASLVDGPVLHLPLHHASYSFSPQSLQPLGDHGIVYPTLRLSAEWGILQVDHGGALLDKEMTLAAVPAASFDASTLSGEGWRLTLQPGWTVKPGSRKGDLVVTRVGVDPDR